VKCTKDINNDVNIKHAQSDHFNGYFLSVYLWRYSDAAGNRTEEKFCRHLLPNPSATVAVSKGMWAVKRCSNKIRQFSTGVWANAGCNAYWL